MRDTEMANELLIIIESYFRSFSPNKRRSVRSLAKKTGVSYISLRRILNKEHVPSVESVLAIIQHVCSRNEGLTFLKKHFPDVGFWLSEYYDDDRQDFIQDALNQQIKQKENFLIISLAATDSGTTKEEISKYLGIFADEKIRNLIDHEILIKDGNRLFTTDKEFGSFEPESVLAQLRNSVDLFNKKNLGQQRALVGVQTDGVSDTGLKKIYKMMTSAELEISKIRKEHPGNNTMVAGFLLNTLDI